MKTNTGALDFSSNQVGWVGVGAGFRPVPTRLLAVTNDAAHPFVPNGTGAQATYAIADLSNPNLRPWVKEQMKKDNDEVLAGKIAYTARSSCMLFGHSIGVQSIPHDRFTSLGSESARAGGSPHMPSTIQPDVNKQSKSATNSVSLILMNETFVSSSTHHGSVGKCKFDELASVRSIAKRTDGHGDWHARGERLRLPALAHQTTRPAHLDGPLLQLSVLINRQYDPGVRTRPLEFLDDASQGDLPFGIEHRKGMMC